jgi:large subunit ribosomal protein L9
MKVLFLKDVGGVGVRGTVKDVSDGYALNFLIPHKLAEQATSDKVAAFEVRRAAELASQLAREAQGSASAKRLDGSTVTVEAKANEKGHLYKQLSSDVIVLAIKKEYGIELAPDSIISDGHIKEVGESKATIKIGKHTARITVLTKAA